MHRGECRLHLRQANLVNAHVIPRAFFPIPIQEDGQGLTLVGYDHVHQRRSPIGWYDQELVCESGEKQFQRWDDYAIKFLRRSPKRIEWVRDADGLIAKNDGIKLGYLVNDVNYALLKLFFLSLLWRASASNRFEFQCVKLGALEENLRKMILSEDPGIADQFGVLIWRYAEQCRKSKIIWHPCTDEICGIPYINFYFGGYIFQIKADLTPTPSGLSETQLAPNRPMYVVQRKFLGSNEHHIAMQMVSNLGEPREPKTG